MDELLKQLLEADVLSEDTKKELEEAFKAEHEQAVLSAKEKTEADVRAELTEQWVQEKDSLVEAIDAKVGEYLNSEIEELKEDIERFRDLEAEYAEKLVEQKAEMRDQLNDDLKELVEKIDAFLEIRLGAEIEELREDIDTVRQNEFGRKIYEAFEEEFANNYADEESAETSLRETEHRLRETEEQLEETERKRAELERSIKMEEILSPLSGRQREVMEAILRNVDTENLEEGYKTFIGRVIREADSEKEGKVLAEAEEGDDDEEDNDSDDDDNGKKKDKKSKKKDKKDDEVKEGVVRNGDSEEVIQEGVDPERDERIARLKRIAGI